MTSTEGELATDIAAILADHKDVAGGAAAVTAYLMPIIAAEADFAARAARAEERRKLVQELRRAETYRARSQGQSEAAVE